MTTIQIDEKTKKKLLEIGGELQARMKKNISFNDTITFLIDTYRGKLGLSALLPLYGSLNKDANGVRRILVELKKEEETRLERLTGRSNH